ncbi:MAG: sodium:proton antiporter [Pseudomonadota bacterium]
MEIFQGLLILLVLAVLLAACARRLKLPYPSLLALGGTALTLLPNPPALTLDPRLTLALFVAPALLDSAFDASLRDLKRYWIPVMSLVVIAVAVTTIAVACLIHYMLPGVPWAAAIAIGAIVAPPDAVAASAVLRRLNIPHRMLMILEGESLLNDATALLIYRIAVSIALGTTLTSANMGMQAGAMVLSVVAGFGLAHFYTRLVAKVSDVPSAIVLQFAGAFGVWIIADEVGLSAIVTIVAFAITAARITAQRTPASLRIPSYAVWETVVFVLNVLAFVLIGLQLRPILGSLEADERSHYLRIAGAVLVTVMLVRIAWVFTYNRIAVLKHRLLGAGKWPGAYVPTLSGSLVVSWAGMRGMVTLAAAYALPAEFPYRDLALLCAFVVVVGTLVVQGLTLRPLILALGIKGDGTVENEVKAAQEALAQVAAEIIDADGSATALVLRDEFVMRRGDTADGCENVRDARNRVRARIVAAQRDKLVRMRDGAEIGDDAFHQLEERLDRIEILVQ